MTIRFHSSVLFSDTPQDLAAFYRDVLQLEVEYDFGACISFTCGLSIWRPGENHSVSTVWQKESRSNRALELCFETEQFPDVVTLLKASNVSLLHDVQEEPWGQYTVRFFDPEQNLLELGESIPCFVRRLHSEGNDADTIAAKTSVPLSRVIEICKG